MHFFFYLVYRIVVEVNSCVVLLCTFDLYEVFGTFEYTEIDVEYYIYICIYVYIDVDSYKKPNLLKCTCKYPLCHMAVSA